MSGREPFVSGRNESYILKIKMFIHGEHRELIFFIETVTGRKEQDKLYEKCAINYMNKQGMILSGVPYLKAELSSDNFRIHWTKIKLSTFDSSWKIFYTHSHELRT